VVITLIIISGFTRHIQVGNTDPKSSNFTVSLFLFSQQHWVMALLSGLIIASRLPPPKLCLDRPFSICLEIQE
jgi:hypothetical protein